MKFQVHGVLTGIRRAKGEFEGTAYDYTELYFEEQFSAHNADAKGASVVSRRYGKSDKFAELQAWTFPCQVQVDLEESAVGGKGQSKIECVAVRRVEPTKKAA